MDCRLDSGRLLVRESLTASSSEGYDPSNDNKPVVNKDDSEPEVEPKDQPNNNNKTIEKIKSLWSWVVEFSNTHETTANFVNASLRGCAMYLIGHYVITPLFNPKTIKSWSFIACIMYKFATPIGNEIIKKTIHIGSFIIGDRARYGQLPLPEKETMAPLRHRAWKAIDRIEKIPAIIDQIFSEKICKIRTEAHIKESEIPDKALTIMEVMRRCVCETVVSNCYEEKCLYPLGKYVIQKIGLSMAAELIKLPFPLLYLFFFLHNVREFYERIVEEQQIEEAQFVEAQTNSCTINR